MMNRFFVSILFCLLVLNPASAALKEQVVAYSLNGTALEGVLVYNDADSAKRPGILVIHDWMGVGPYVIGRCRQLAELGYVAFAADIYGKGVRPANREEASQQAGIYKKDRALMRARVTAGLNELKKQLLVDPAKIAAIGYCFGGTTVIELARSGAELSGVVSFHGGLDSPTPADGKNIKTKLLILHGADDPFVPADDLQKFQQELRDAKVDWQMVSYGNAVHSFTHKDAGDDPSKGAAYEARADRRSWQAMKSFFAELFEP